MSSHPATVPTPRPAGGPGGSSAVWKVAVLLLGIAVGVLAIAAVAAVQAADQARDEVDAAAQPSNAAAPAVHDHSAAASANQSLPLQSFAGTTGANADALAKAHAAYDATLPPVPAGDLVKIHMTLKDMVVEIAPGVRYNTWAFDGHGAPGPILHVRQGQTVQMTLTNGGTIPHSIDFHAARIAPNLAFRDVAPGESFTFHFTANDPGVFMYHCGTKPVLAHIANGMYGALVVDPATPLPKADKQYVLVASEWYLNGDGVSAPASLDMSKARATMPDWTTFNGYANQYVTHPLTAKPGETVRFYVVAAGPTRRPDPGYDRPRVSGGRRARGGEALRGAEPAPAAPALPPDEGAVVPAGRHHRRGRHDERRRVLHRRGGGGIGQRRRPGGRADRARQPFR